ncbi:MAG: type I DNA topoisomerase, partial [candidate division Zixibacteria bacterium]
GEAIAWHLANTLKASKCEFFRVTFNEITATAVREAFENPREINLNLVNAQQARRVLDRLVGYRVSPFLWKTIARNLSAGRVQSVALRLVVEREEEIAAFKATEYWQIKALLDAEGKEFSASLYKVGDKTVVKPADMEKNPKNKIILGSKKEVDKILAGLKKTKYSVSEIKRNERKRKALPPFITSTLQQDAARAYGFSPKQTMATAQKLYEGIEIGKEGQVGLITYMRTDSVRVSNDALKAARSFIKKNYGDDYLPAKPIQYGSKKKVQDAHEAIRPTYMELPPDKVKKSLTVQQFKLYKLIWNRFLASQMKEAKYSVETVLVEAGEYQLRASAQRLLFDGFLKVYAELQDSEDNGNGNDAGQLPELTKGQMLKLSKLDPQQSFTKPPPRYSEAMLVKRLESDGIGRPSTYASIISVIKDRKYVELLEKRLHPTDLGKTVCKILVENFPDIFNVEFTASMERELDAVEDGTDDWVKVLSDFYGPLNDTLEKLKGKESEIKASMVEVTKEKCRECDGFMVIKWGRNGRFLGCQKYPDCRHTRPLPEEEAASKTDQKCEKCGSDMIIKTGRFGRFMACSGYPKCKNTKPVTLKIDCPKPDCDGKISERQTKGKRLFYGCTKYPDCKFASWDKPVAQPCPDCKHPFLVLKISKVKGEFLQCPDCKAKIAQEPAESEPVA